MVTNVQIQKFRDDFLKALRKENSNSNVVYKRKDSDLIERVKSFSDKQIIYYIETAKSTPEYLAELEFL